MCTFCTRLPNTIASPRYFYDDEPRLIAAYVDWCIVLRVTPRTTMVCFFLDVGGREMEETSKKIHTPTTSPISLCASLCGVFSLNGTRAFAIFALSESVSAKRELSVAYV